MYLDMCPHVSLCRVSIWVYIGVCVSLIDGRIKTTSICGIITDHIVKELDGTGSQEHNKDYVGGTTYHNQNSSNSWLWRSHRQT